MTTQKIESIIYTDGSCLKNPGGASGWCFCLLEGRHEWFVTGGELSSTNNRMELTAIIEALTFLHEESCILYTDSLLSLNCAIGKWKRKSNLDLWERFDQVSQGKTINWKWVKAHSGDRYNELVDDLARTEAKMQKK